jgi:hypothetical protein
MAMKLLDHLINQHLPMPGLLAAALRAGRARIAKTERGEVAYFNAPHCPNVQAVKPAIDA